MSLFSFFRDPTHDWPESRPVPLVYDLARRELNGIPAGAPADRLRALGRPCNRKPSWIGIFAYPRLGIQVHLGGDRVQSVTCVFHAKLADTKIENHPDFWPCKIELRLPGGETVRITPDTGREDVERRLGSLTLDGTPPFPSCASRWTPWISASSSTPAVACASSTSSPTIPCSPDLDCGCVQDTGSLPSGGMALNVLCPTRARTARGLHLTPGGRYEPFVHLPAPGTVRHLLRHRVRVRSHPGARRTGELAFLVLRAQ
jgi:hypothetical protein